MECISLFKELVLWGNGQAEMNGEWWSGLVILGGNPSSIVWKHYLEANSTWPGGVWIVAVIAYFLFLHNKMDGSSVCTTPVLGKLTLLKHSTLCMRWNVTLLLFLLFYSSLSTTVTLLFLFVYSCNLVCHLCFFRRWVYVLQVWLEHVCRR